MDNLMDRYEVIKEDHVSKGVLEVLVEQGYLRKMEPIVFTNVQIGQWADSRPKPDPAREIGKHLTYNLKIEPEDNTPCNQYIGNHLPIESNIEKIARDILGVVEDKKLWQKELKEAVKAHGHDEVLESFYQWSQGWAGSFLGKKPVSFFLKNIDNNIGTTRKPTVTNPALDRVSQKIAYISDNKVFFTGDFRIRLASIIRDHGEELVVRAFEAFFQDVDDKGLPWAARDFLKRGHIMILTLKQKQSETEMQKQLFDKAIQEAKESVIEDSDEEETPL